MTKPTSNRFDRRTFLYGGAAAAGILGMPDVITSTALGGQGRPAASERITTGYIGVGPRGLLNMREQLSCADAQVVAVCDVWKGRREGAKKEVDRHYKNTDCSAYNDFRELLARSDIDAVGIASPDHWHVPMTIMAAKAGKDVCVEKPLGISVEQDQVCRDVIRRYDRVFQYGTEARALEACRVGCELIRSGRIGQIREIRVKAPNSVRGGSRQPKEIPPDLDYELWLGPAPFRPYSGCPDRGPNWFHVRDYALGFIAGWGAHPLDLLEWAFDTHGHGDLEIKGTGAIPTEGCNDAVLDWDVHIRFADGVDLTYWATGLEKEEEPRLAKLNNYAQFIGTEGWIAVYYASMMCEPESIRQVPIGPDDVHLPVSRGQERNFIQCVKTRETPVSNLDQAVRSDIMSHLSEIAIRTGRKIAWNPQEENILDDEAATRMLTRPMRDSWK